jgi:hypothetical protein
MRGRTMPQPPPITQESWRTVSERAKTDVRTVSGTSRWIIASRDSLPSELHRPATRPSRISVGKP